jgi:hypothetical protein
MTDHRSLLFGYARCARHGRRLDEHLSADDDESPVRRVYVCLDPVEPCAVADADDLEAFVRERVIARIGRMYELTHPAGPGRAYADRQWKVLDHEHRRRLLNLMVQHVIVRAGEDPLEDPLEARVDVLWQR